MSVGSCVAVRGLVALSVCGNQCFIAGAPLSAGGGTEVHLMTSHDSIVEHVLVRIPTL